MKEKWENIHAKKLRIYAMKILVVSGLFLEFLVIQCIEPLPPTQAPRYGSCPRNWELWGESCYYFGSPDNKEEMNWTWAQKECKVKAGGDLAANATLVSINTDTENDFIKTKLLGLNVYGAWIGLSKIKKGRNWVWMDGSIIQYKNWAPMEPNNVKGVEDCGKMIVGIPVVPGEWNDISCSQRQHSICKAPMQPQPPKATSGDHPCPHEWEQWEKNCYYLNKDYNTWLSAIHQCEVKAGGDLAANATLASINTATENDFIKTKLRDINVKRAWIGLKKTDDGFLWTDGSPTDYMNWATGEPNDVDSKENCVEMNVQWYPQFARGMWNDVSCSATEQYFVCEATVLERDRAGLEIVQSSDEQSGENVDWLIWVPVCSAGVVITLVLPGVLFAIKKARGRRSELAENDNMHLNARDDIHPPCEVDVQMRDDDDHHTYCSLIGDDHHYSAIVDYEEMNGNELSTSIGTSPAQPKTTNAAVPVKVRVKGFEAMDSQQRPTTKSSIDPKPPIPHRVPSQSLAVHAKAEGRALDPDPLPSKLRTQNIKHYIMTANLVTEHQALTIEARNQASSKPRSKPTHLAEKQSINSSNVNPLLPKRVVECGSIPSAENLPQFWNTISSGSAIGASAIVLLTDKNKTMNKTDLHWLPTSDDPILLPSGLEVLEKRRQEVDGITRVTIRFRARDHTYNNVKYDGHTSTYMDMPAKFGKQHDCQVLVVDPTSPAGIVSAWRILQNTLHFTACSFKRDDMDVFAVCMFLLDQSHAFDAVDVPAALKQLRKQHPTMISNVEDYYFIYKVLEVFSDK